MLKYKLCLLKSFLVFTCYLMLLIAPGCNSSIDNKSDDSKTNEIVKVKQNTDTTITKQADSLILSSIPDFNINRFIDSTEALLTSIIGKKINLKYTVDTSVQNSHIQRRFDFTPGKGNERLRFWILINSYTNRNKLDENFKNLQNDAYGINEKRISPGLTYTNDYVIKSEKYIVWLNTGCPYAFFNHQRIKQYLLQSLNIGVIHDSIICKCGQVKCSQ